MAGRGRTRYLASTHSQGGYTIERRPRKSGSHSSQTTRHATNLAKIDFLINTLHFPGTDDRLELDTGTRAGHDDLFTRRVFEHSAQHAPQLEQVAMPIVLRSNAPPGYPSRLPVKAFCDFE